jgi:radical SAM superfamily enzyme YgiQ (UPF0313 family)
MVNGSFVFGMDHDDESVFERTVNWAIVNGIETATFHILTPYPSTELYKRMISEDRMVCSDWDKFDTRHVVYKPARISAEALEAGYWRAYRDFYTWSSILQGASTKELMPFLRHLAYAGGWKKFEPVWDAIIKSKRVVNCLPILESVLSAFGRFNPSEAPVHQANPYNAERLSRSIAEVESEQVTEKELLAQ